MPEDVSPQKSSLNVACIQMTSGVDIQENIHMAAEFVKEAAKNGAEFIATPENTGAMIHDSKVRYNTAFTEEDHPAISAFSNLANSLNIWLLIGSLATKVSGTKLANRSYLFNPDGQTAAVYQKIHMFAVDLPTGESHREADYMEPGSKAVIAQMPKARLGMTICYDMRFPHMYRQMAVNGAEIFAVPSAFTVPTGRAHWHVMLRARAIETGCFVVAPAQCGTHDGGRQTYGHSIIIDPWGRILAEAEEKPGIIYAELDLSLINESRKSLAQLQHDREYEIEKTG